MSRRAKKHPNRPKLELLEQRRLLAVWPVADALVNTYTTGWQSNVSMGMDASGNYVIAWDSYEQDGESGGIYAQRFNSSGQAQGSEFRVNSVTSGSQWNPAVAMDSDGDFVVAWEDAASSEHYGIFAQRYSSAGVPVGDEIKVDVGTVGQVSDLSVVTDADGNFLVTWNTLGRDVGKSVYGQRFNNAGAAQGAAFQLLSTRSDQQAWYDVAMDADGDFVAVWQADGGNWYEIFAKRFSASGVASGSSFQVNTYTTGRQAYPAVSMTGAGDFIVVWGSEWGPEATPGGIYGRRYNSAGVAQGNPTQLGVIAAMPNVAMSSNGEFVVTGYYGQLARRFDAAGLPLEDVFKVYNQTTGHSPTSDALAIDASGEFVVAWGDLLDSASDTDIYQRLYQTLSGGQMATVAGTAWEDVDGDGIQEADEPGLASVTVDLIDAQTGAPIATDIADSSGAYSFNVKIGQSLQLRFTTPAKFTYIPTRQDKGTNDIADSDIDRVTGLAPTFVLNSAGQVFTTIDAGFTKGTSLEGVFFNDRNENGVRELHEEIVPDLTVFADYDGDGVLDPDEPVSSRGVWTPVAGPQIVGYVLPGHIIDPDDPYIGLLPGNTHLRVVAQEWWNGPANLIINVPQYTGGATTTVNIPLRTTAPETVATFAGDPTRVGTATTGGGPSIARDAVGNYVVVWPMANGTTEIFARLYTSTGAPKGEAFIVNSYTTGAQTTPVVAMDDAGNFVVAWAGEGADGVSEIYAQRFNPSGARLGSEFLVNTQVTGTQAAPLLAMNSNGEFAIAWRNDTVTPGLVEILVQRFAAAGNALGQPIIVDSIQFPSNLVFFGAFHSIAMDDDGDFAVSWVGKANTFGLPGYDKAVYVQRYGSNGLAVGDRIVVDEVFSAGGPDVVMNGGGAFVVTWAEGNALYGARYSAAGVLQGGLMTLASSATLPVSNGWAVVLDDDGSLTVALHSASGGTGGRVYIERFNAAGLAQGSPFRVASDVGVTAGATTSGVVVINPFPQPSPDGAQLLPDVAADADGNLLVAWINDDIGGGYSLYTRRMTVFPAGEATTVGGRVWNDHDGDGIRETGEPGIGNVSVSLYASDHTLIGTTLTDTNGDYAFLTGAGMSAYLSFASPAGHIETQPNIGANDSVDSDIDPSTNRTAIFQTTTSTTTSMDAGFAIPSTIGGGMFNDADGDGVRDPGEGGVPGFQVFIDYDGDGVRDADEVMTTSDVDGSYTLRDVLPGSHSIRVVDQLLWQESAPRNATVDPGATLAGFNLGQRTTAPTLARGEASGEIQVNSYTTGSQAGGHVTLLPNGSYVVTWAGAGPENGINIYARRFGSNNTPLGDSFLVSNTGGDARLPRIASDGSGNFIITWYLYYGSEAEDYIDGFARRFNSEGQPLSDPFLVSSSAAGEQFAPTPAMRSNGEFMITWSGEHLGNTQIFARRFGASGSPLGSEFIVNSLTTRDHMDPVAAFDADGDFVVAWTEWMSDAVDKNNVFARRFNSAGNAVGMEFRVNDYTADFQQGPSVGMAPDGAFVIAWSDQRPNRGIYAQRFSADGNLQGANFRVNTTGPGLNTIGGSSVGMDSAGNFLITWTAFDRPGDVNYGGYGQLYNYAGLPQGAEFHVNSTTSGSQSGATVSLRDGTAVVAWTSDNQDGSGPGVFARRYQITSTAASTPAPTPTGPAAILEHGLLRIYGSDSRDDVILDKYFEKYVVVLTSRTPLGITIPKKWEFNRADVLAVEVYTGEGDDKVTIKPGLMATYVNGGYGNDTLIAGTRHDSLTGAAGKDLLIGGLGNDRLDGGKHNDVIEGREGNDRLYGGEGNDNINGGEGGDRMYGGAHDDTLLGANQNDTIYGEAGNDSIDGGNHGDRIDGGVGADSLFGNRGNDVIWANDGVLDLINGGLDQDTAFVDLLDTPSLVEQLL